ncbi:MAG: LuxR C-terminal-related transcriptional regulator [Peptococcaceae bacterium]
MRNIKILVVEPDLLVRKGLIAILNQEEDLEVIGEAQNAGEALDFIKNNDVDVVVTELWLQDEHHSLLATIGKQFPGKTKIVVLTSSQEAKHLFDAMRLGAQGYLLKTLEPKIWIEVIRSVVAENEPLASGIACDILRQFAEQLANEKNAKTDSLTQREREILHLVTLGHTNQQIGGILNISPNTVKNHIKRISNKVNVDNRAHLVAFGVRHGFTVKK